MTFHYRASSLHCDSIPLTRLADEFGTPLYVYSASRLADNFHRLTQAFIHPSAPISQPLICYSVKANSNLSLLRLLQDLGAGFDVVSGGELYCALKAGADPAKIVFAGVGKTESEMEFGVSEGVGWFNVESEDELVTLNAVAGRMGARRAVTAALRLNPGVEPDTHKHIRTSGAHSKFGLPVEAALALCRDHRRFPNVRLRGVHIHIGSQLPGPEPTLAALGAALEVMAQARALGLDFDTLDLGGGFPIPYREQEMVPSFEEFAEPILSRVLRPSSRQAVLRPAKRSFVPRLILEPGRSLAADAGALVVTAQAVKRAGDRQLAIVDGGMNVLLRPALYDAYHRVLPLLATTHSPLATDVAGPICESADFLAHDRQLPPLRRGDRLAVLDAGAYGFAMASHYNSHPLPAEALVEGEAYRLIRRREAYEDLVAAEI